ncbi:hypothetical protein [Komagataeibacter medellinensis]|uniref:hypothetical protein n=1 Tax=Komagataeibacter medellinensis TaxID=1177712 RepID=UPI0003A2398F|nr:hypothetical protein [Komagataeibacter medellinensis]
MLPSRDGPYQIHLPQKAGLAWRDARRALFLHPACIMHARHTLTGLFSGHATAWEHMQRMT